ncbi:MAG: hypoxanthine phosphoribosyltransferase [Ignavibacteria bacterium]|nr:hypoxanthine phosphoribosyltransferase [Ignavibacteria bacterium]
MDNSVAFKRDNLTILGKKFVPFIRSKEITKRIKFIAKEIRNDYKGKIPVFVVILKGAIFFAAELLKNINIPLRVETLKAKSYGNSMQSSGKVDLFVTGEDFAGKDLIIVEDIIDTGLTISTIIDKLSSYKPNSLEIATLLMKPKNLRCDLRVKYCGFEIPEKFVIGYGLDFAEFGRNLKDIYILE